MPELKPDMPKGVQIGDFIVGRFIKSDWSRFFPWENWDHVALITRVNPLTVIEASGIILQRADKKSGKSEIREGVVEYEFLKPRTVINLDGSKNHEGNLWLTKDLMAMQWARPKFPSPLREIDYWKVPWKKRKIISELGARKRAVAYARSQVGDPHSLLISKRSTTQWYCSLLVFKAYSRTVTNMYLESYEPISGFHVTPEDLVQSKRSEVYYSWSRNNP